MSQPALVPDLVEFLGRVSCTAGVVRGSTVDVSLPAGGDAARARRHLDLYLAAWGALHPPVRVSVLEDEPPR